MGKLRVKSWNVQNRFEASDGDGPDSEDIGQDHGEKILAAIHVVVQGVAGQANPLKGGASQSGF